MPSNQPDGGCMSKKNPECPVAVPRNCPDYKNARVCALVRADKKCTRKPGASKSRIDVNIGPGHQYEKPRAIRNVETRVTKGDARDFTWRRRL